MRTLNRLRRRALFILTALASGLPLTGGAATSSDFDAKPPVVTQSATPLVMLTMSNDHQLFYKAYTDWDDIDGDGEPENTYSSTIEYYGYFNSKVCYDYASSTKRFEPAGATDVSYYCTGSTSGKWSGNFLNWASMTRIDALRKVLYGGTRYSESAGDTSVVLERAFLPSDAHSFAKYYAGSDLNKLTPFTGHNDSGITFCNTTYSDSGVSQDVTDPPLIRVAKGDYRYWAANERWQCTWDDEHGDNSSGTNTTGSHTTDPSESSDGLGDKNYVARVQVCASGYREENCRAYTDGGTTYYRPAGLLQRFGEDGQIHFGLLTGSYDNNKSGGVVRRDVRSFAAEIRADGTFDSSVDGVVSSIEKLRIANYNYGGSGDNTGSYNEWDDCAWAKTSFDEGDCSNWGNPISEMYLEAVRYFAGLSPNSSFTGDDTGYIDGLTQLSSWQDPLNAGNRCASCNIVVINASDISYDDDALGMTDLPKDGSSSPSATSWTKTVGDKEEITGNSYFVGENGAGTDQLCTAKAVDDLGTVKGVCPNAPRLSGTYNMAGIAYWAHTQDIREDLADEQTVNTYAVTLSPAVPNIRIPVPSQDGKVVTILPACRNTSLDPDANCAIVDFKILSQDIAAGTGSFYVNWEDSEQGGDYDQDMKGVLSYSINTSGTEISVETDVNEESTSYAMGFGYVITGTTDDGFHVHSGIHDFVYEDDVTDCSEGCQVGDAASSHTYTIGSSSAQMLKDPLWYTAKYGGFKDYDRDDDPNEDEDSEWDVRDNEGNQLADGSPDNYYPVTNPKQLETRMEQVFNNILDRISSGTAAAVVSNSASGVGAVYQALYQPLTQNGDQQVSWSGFLHALFIDNKGLLREDSNGDGMLGSYTTDLVVRIYFDEVDRETRVQRYTTVDQGKTLTPSGIPVTVADLKPVWQAHQQLSTVPYSDSNRSYESSAGTGRYIVSSIGGELKAFQPDVFGTGSLYRHLGLTDSGTAQALIQFIRGKEGLANSRSRTVDYDDDGSDDIMRLGDIIHSSPVVVGAPDQPYPIVHGDTSYVAYKTQYEDRRQVVYVGANDGMIHAFNGGFWDSGSNAFRTSPPGEDKDSNDDGVDDTAHPLGTELWAYVPQNLLPHLRWLKEPDYPHVYYMDGSPLVFDANIFAADATHPNGWGTVLVMGMRLGGAPVGVDSDGDGADNYTARSAYVVLDITDPEQAPSLIAEITAADLGFTTSKPAVLKRRAPGAGNDWANPSVNEWYLVFGSGPTELDSATSDQKARIYAYDLNAKAFVSGLDPLEINEPQGFVGDLNSVDWDNDYKDDAAYFGTVAGSVASPSGALYRLYRSGGSAALSELLDADRPFLSAPSLQRSTSGARWVYAGTGRLLVQADIATTSQQGFYGVREPVAGDGSFTWGTVSSSNLQQVTGVQVFENGTVKDPKSVIDDALGIDTYSKLASHIEDNADGWYKLFSADGTSPAGRNVTPATQISSILLYSVYSPSTDACMPEGYSTLYAVNYETGVAEPYGALGVDTSVKHEPVEGEVHYVVRESTKSTAGLSSGPVVHSGTGGTTVVENYSTGALGGSLITLPPVSSSRLSWREIEL